MGEKWGVVFAVVTEICGSVSSLSIRKGLGSSLLPGGAGGDRSCGG